MAVKDVNPAAVSLIDSRVGERSRSSPVLFLLNGLGIAGSERKSVAVLNELARTGKDVHLAYLDARTQLLDSVANGVSVIFLNRRGKFSISSVRALRTYVSEHSIATIACINIPPLIYAYCAIRSLSTRKRPEVILFENTTEHSGWKAQLLSRGYAPILRRVDKFVFGCLAQQSLWLSRFKLDPARCRVIYNGIDQNRFRPGTIQSRFDPSPHGISLARDDFVIGAVGNLWRNKNHIEIITALTSLKATLPNAKLVIAGEGSERERLEAAIEAGDLRHRVALLGKVFDVRPMLDRIDVFVLPSVSETFSNATLEAMSMGKPVVVKKTGGMPEMIHDGVNGFLYEEGNVEQLAKIVERLSSNSRLREEIGASARRSVVENFTFARMADDYRKLLF